MKTRFLGRFVLPMILGFFTMYSCTEKDYYDPDFGGGKKENPLDIEVPANMNWSMISTVNLTVNVDDEYNGEYFYVVEVYDKEPLSSEDAKLLAKGIAKKGKVFTATIETIAGQNTLFIKRTDPRGRSVVGCAELQEGNTDISYDFVSNNTTTRAMASTKAEIANIPTYDKVPAGAIEVKGSEHEDWFTGGENYCITKDYKGGIYHNGRGECKLFVSGTWTIPESATNWKHQIESGLEVIILPGGKIIDKGDKISFVGTSGLTVMPGGSFECDELEFTNSGIIYNLGIIKAEDITLQANTTLYNNCSIIVDDDFNSNASDIIIHMNKGSIKAEDITFNNVTIHLENGCLIKAEEIDNMSYTTYIATGNTSLVTAEEIKCNSSVLYNGKLVIEAEEHPKGNEWWSPYKLQNGAVIANKGQANIVIETCNGEHHEPNPGPDPEDPIFPIEITTNADYIFAMEDQWPFFGDYDMNDVVVGVSPQITNYVDKNDTKVKQVKFNVRILAIGALKKIAAAIQLDKISPDQVESVKYYTDIKNILDTNFFINSNGVESNQDKAVIPLFGNANNLLGGNFVNVGMENKATPIEFTVVVNFKDNAKIKPEDLGYKALNFFIIPNLDKIQSKQRRPEIHLGGYDPTNLANPDLFDEGVDNGTKKYISEGNMVWGLIIPTKDWECPNEGVNIMETYEHFKEWVVSGGKQYPEWYKEKK